MTFEEACKRAIKRFLDDNLDYGIKTVGETSDNWYFVGGFNEKGVVDYCAYALKINKQTGEQTDMSLIPENDDELTSVELIDIPEKYKIKYKE